MTVTSTPRIRFTKASACGNDFLIIEGESVAPNLTKRGAHEMFSVGSSAIRSSLAELSQRLCDRHNGVGADGVEWTFPDREADAMARLINADGSEAEISGNGTRCVAAEIVSRAGMSATGKKNVVVRTGAGVKTLQLIKSHETIFDFEADMGLAQVGDELTIHAQGVRVTGTKVSTGNPHFVIFCEQFPEDWQRQGSIIQIQPQFPQGTNVEFVSVRGPNEIEIRLFERGVGETQSSGTGSCASAVAAVASGRVKSPVKVVAPGGAQTVRWDGNIYLRGPATLICQGEFFL